MLYNTITYNTSMDLAEALQQVQDPVAWLRGAARLLGAAPAALGGDHSCVKYNRWYYDYYHYDLWWAYVY